MRLTSPRRLGLICSFACIGVAACGRTWVLPGEDGATTGDVGDNTALPDPGVTSSDGDVQPDPTSDSTGDDSDIEPDEPPPPTCREILECLANCLSQGGTLDCLGTCSEGAEPAETQAAAALMGCLARTCIQSGACTLDALDDPNCLTCIGLGLVVPVPTGCEEEAAACQ